MNKSKQTKTKNYQVDAVWILTSDNPNDTTK